MGALKDLPIEDDEEGEEEQKDNSDGTIKVIGNLVTFVNRLDEEYTKALIKINPHTQEYVTRLELKEPGIFACSKVKGEALKEKEESGEPMSKQRVKLRRQCKPKGAIGYLLGTVHLNKACMDMDFNIWQYNQVPIRATEAAYQVVGPQVQHMAARNRIARKEDPGEECMDLKEWMDLEERMDLNE